MKFIPSPAIAHFRKSFCALALLFVFNPAIAENLTDAEKVLCAPAQINICVDSGDCASVLPWEVNVPQFIEVDFEQKRLATTAASERNRVTPIETLSRDEGVIYLQGLEAGRAFSIVITESPGIMTFAVARNQVTVTGFGVCTPVE